MKSRSHRTRLAVGLALVAFLVPLASSSGRSGGHPAGHPGVAASVADVVRGSGVPGAWSIEPDGSVYVRLPAEEGEGDLWFRARPDRTDNAAVERLVLDAVLFATETGDTLTITGSRERALDGDSPESAFPLVRLEHP